MGFMITKKQQKWINHLSDTEKIKILPYDPVVKLVFKNTKQEIQSFLEKDVSVEHHGATSLKISGQGEIDSYIPVLPLEFDNYLEKLVEIFGEPGSVYPLQRARFVQYRNNIKIEIFLINKEHDNYKDLLKFEDILKNNKILLRKYEELKQKADGYSVREYYRRKTIFINEILARSL